jgi:hypothetical protein
MYREREKTGGQVPLVISRWWTRAAAATAGGAGAGARARASAGGAKEKRKMAAPPVANLCNCSYYVLVRLRPVILWLLLSRNFYRCCAQEVTVQLPDENGINCTLSTKEASIPKYRSPFCSMFPVETCCLPVHVRKNLQWSSPEPMTLLDHLIHHPPRLN